MADVNEGDAASSTSSGQKCAICLTVLQTQQEGGGAIKELPCKHLFHQDCIDRWLMQSLICPNCRAFAREVRRQPADPGRRSIRVHILHAVLSFSMAWTAVFWWAPMIVPPCKEIAILALLLICIIRLVVMLVCVALLICRRCDTFTECSSFYAFASILPIIFQILLVYGVNTCKEDGPALITLLVYEGCMTTLSIYLLCTECGFLCCGRQNR